MSTEETRKYLVKEIFDCRGEAAEYLQRAVDARDLAEETRWMRRAEGAEDNAQFCELRLKEIRGW
jgi:hypothetical protein